MLDFEASKLVLIGIVALIFIGPKELPRVLRQLGQIIAKMRSMAAEFQGQFMDAMKEADLENLRQDLAKVKDSANFNVDFNPIRDIKNEIGAAGRLPQTSPTQPEAEPPTIVAAPPMPPAVTLDVPPPEAPAPVAMEEAPKKRRVARAPAKRKADAAEASADAVVKAEP